MDEFPHRMRVNVLPGRFAVCRLGAADPIPAWAHGRGLVSITRTHEELSIVCEEDRVPSDVRCERGYSAFGVKGPLAPEMVGVLASLASPLAAARVPILAIGTFDTDYLLVRNADMERTITTLREAGHHLPPE